MTEIKFKISQSQPMKVHAVAVAFMLIVSYFAYPYAAAKLECDVALGLISCFGHDPSIFVYVAALPTVYVAVILLGLLVAKKEPHKEAMVKNLKKTNTRYYMLAAFYCGMSIFMFFSVYLPEDFMDEHQGKFQLFVSIATILFIFFVANVAPKMNRSLFSGWACRWNLKSELAWEKSQRFAGFALTIVCVICLIISFTAVNWAIPALALGIGLNYIGVLIVSRHVYKKELSQKLNN
ncbi:MAG: SdpI family protein [Alphaproteobacteria bacterium]|nr:SdpI family protein [Alphaproteobacteria bacterium]